MIQNRWKNVLAQKGMTQAQVAKFAGISTPLFSSVVNGVSILPMPDLESVCKVLDIEPTKVYPTDVLKTIYGIEARKQAQQSVSIKLRGRDLELFNEIKKELGSTLSPNIELVRTMMIVYKHTLNRQKER